jgi:hypothetical protein
MCLNTRFKKYFLRNKQNNEIRQDVGEPERAERGEVQCRTK